VYCGAGSAAAAGAEDAGELTTRRLRAGVRGVGAVSGTAAAATGELVAAGTAAAPFTGLPWLGVTVSATAAAAAVMTRSEIAPVIIPLRKLTSSSRALMAARMPGHEPAVR
jgi:hypothetical protein